MRVLGHMVVRNEADRFLRQSLRSLRLVCSDIAVFDDLSDDDTVAIARDAGARCWFREPTDPSFAEHEGRFRQLAWEFMEEALEPEVGDWILCLDADEVLVADDGDVRAIWRTLNDAPPEVDAFTLRIHELWTLAPPNERVDGYWGTIVGTRLYRWKPDQSIADKAMASGSVPAGGKAALIDNPRIAHLGYIREADRRSKFERYNGRTGHSSKHVQSILAAPTLRSLEGRLCG